MVRIVKHVTQKCQTAAILLYIHLYFTISVANNYTTIQYNTKTRKASTDHRQIEQASSITSLQGQSRKCEQEIIDRVIFYEKSLSFIINYGAR